MRRLSLSTKLFAAALPLIIAVGGLLALTVRSDLDAVNRAESGAELGLIWGPLISALDAIEIESATLSPTSSGAGSGASSPDDLPSDPDARRVTDQAVNDVRTAIENLGAFDAASGHVTAGRSALSAARRNLDMAAIAPTMVADIDPVEAYGIAKREFVAVGQLLPSEAGDAELGRELLAVVKLAEAKLLADDVVAGTSAWPNELRDDTPLVQARTAFAKLVSTVGEFEGIAPEAWTDQFRQSGFNTALGEYSSSLTSVARAADAGRVETFDTAGFADFIDRGTEFQRTISQSIVDRAATDTTANRNATLRRIGIILACVLLALLIAWFIIRSVTRRVKAIANSANHIASEQLPALVEALRDPRGKAMLPDIQPVNAKGGDDLSDLAHAFNSMQETLIEVAHEQVEVLRRGVSDIFITMARRNRSLIDRQLSMLDEFEASVDDHEVLSNYYQLDHLATRMRRNSESLLVLANAEPKRRRVKATEIDDVVRASIGEVEDYRRIEIQHLESLQVSGGVVADISHLLAELLDNATSFSPPGSTVRVGGRRAGDSYMLRIVDDGVGIGPERLGELNELLREPPLVGLSVESTLGVSVVSLLAHKHDIDVTLSAGSPGLTVDVILPSKLFGPMDAPAEQPTLPSAAVAGEPIVAWTEQPTPAPAPAAVAEPQRPAEFDPYERAPEPTHASAGEPVVAQPVATQPVAPDPVAADPVASDWTKLSLDVSAFETTAPAAPVAAAPVAPAPAPTVNEPEPVAADPVADDWTKMSLDTSVFDTTPPAAEPVAPTPIDDLPPPPPTHGEFDVPPAPPIGANGLTQRPVSPDSARPAPIPTPSAPTTAPLPTRTQRGTGPEGPDRLAAPAVTPMGDTPVATTEPGALQAALAAFDSGRAAVNAQPAGLLPTRDPSTATSDPLDDTLPVTQSRVDPSALRDRLRAFQSEFTSASNDPTGNDIYSDHNDQHPDLGGDPR